MSLSDAVCASSITTTALTTRSYTYYPTGALKSVSENGVTLTYTYDERGNVLTESDGTSVKSYTYNEFDGRASYTLKVNNIAIASETYAYDAARQLASVTTDSVQVTYGYDMNGNRITDRTINPTTGLEVSGHNYAFDGANRVVRVQGMVLANNGASLLIPVSETYTYNLDGSRSSKLDNNTSVTTSYGYDGAGRLTYEIEGSAVTTYAYDASNNRTSMLSGGVTTTYTYDANNRLLSEVKGSQVTNYTYDANGNQLSGNGLVTYDARGRQSTWTDGLTTASYTYYPTDLRKSKTVGATTTNFVWDGQNMVYEYNGTNTTGGTAYYYGLTLISQGNYAYYLYNGHGDVVQLVTASGTLGKSYDYDAFGNEVSPSASDTNPFRYAGQYFDSETGTYYLRARYYDPGMGRFTQQDGWAFADPNDPLSLNLYTYCWNDPIKYYDPWGNDAIWLQYDQAAFTMGHTGLLLQDSDGAWFLFYWGTSHTLSALNPFKNQELIPKQKLWRKLDNYEFDTENPLSSVQIYLESMTQKYIDPTSNRNLSSGITDALYFEGDFTESVKYLNEMIGSMADQEALYNLYTNNCLQVSMDALAKGTFDKHNKYYQYAIQYARASLIPNDAFRGMRHFANTIDEYMRMSTWQKLVSATPYAYFNNFSKLLRGFPWLFG